jgi:hypothetical protein
MNSSHLIMCVFVFMNMYYDILTDILRGLAASTFGSFNLRTPSFISA